MPEIIFNDGVPAANPDNPAPSTPIPSTTDVGLAALDASAAGPAKITIDGQATEEHPLPDQIEYLKFRMANRALRKPGAGISIQKLQPHGSVYNAGE